MYNHLSDNGLLVFEIETLNAAPTQLNIWKGNAYYKSDGKLIIASFLELPTIDNIGSSICRYELVDGNQIIKTEIEDFKVRLYKPNDMIVLLKEVGFKKIYLTKAFARNTKPDEGDKLIVYECKK